jgi:cyclase
MLKTRLIPALFIKNGLIVRSEKFNYHQIIGNIVNEAQRYNEWNVDELIYIDISRETSYDLGRNDHRVESYSNLQEMMTLISGVCFMPLCLGGGIRTLEQIDFLIKNGADKITLNTGAIENPGLIKEASLKYGAQAVVLSIDYKMAEGKPIIFSKFGSINTGILLTDWIKECEKQGAGELFLNTIEKDGMANGYDIENIGMVVESTGLPVIACGGAGDFYDFVDLAKQTKVSGIAAGNIFHFTERSYPRAKQLLKQNGINVR